MNLTAKFLQKADQEEGEERNFRGLQIVLENPKGTIREGVDPDGKTWHRTMNCDYGYVPDTEGAGDKEGLDVFVGEDDSSPYAYVVEQLDDDGEFDEYKVMLGFPDLQSAEDMYVSHYPEGWGEEHIGEIWEVPLRELFDGIRDNQEKMDQKYGSKTASLNVWSLNPSIRSAQARDAERLHETNRWSNYGLNAQLKRTAPKRASNDVIDAFLRDYRFDFYEKVAEDVRKELEDLLRDAGIRALVTCRAKRVESLRQKLQKRDSVKQYQTLEQILEDIKDLAGVRVALYFPRDADRVDGIIKMKFSQARPPKHFPQDREPEENEGYRATHYTVSWDKTLVEIQVASLLMHAWAETVHDLLYKPLIGQLAPAELQIIDSFNNLISSGESTLDDLQTEIEIRTGRPLALPLLAALKKKLAKMRYQTCGDGEVCLYHQRFGTAQERWNRIQEQWKVIWNKNKKADELDDKLKAIWETQNVQPSKPGPDDNFMQQALQEIAPGTTRMDALPNSVLRRVVDRAQELKAKAKAV